MFKNKVIFIVLSFVCLAVGCASNSKPQESNLDRTVKLEEPANSPSEIAHRGAQVFANAPGLTAEQRSKLLAIFTRTQTQSAAIRTELGKSKSLMFKLVASVKHNSEDVNQLKAKIVGLDQKRLDVMFKALADVQEVVGYGDGKQEIYEFLRNYQGPPTNILIGHD